MVSSSVAIAYPSSRSTDEAKPCYRPDLCDGTYDAYCNMTPRFSNISEILSHYGQSELLEFMDRY